MSLLEKIGINTSGRKKHRLGIALGGGGARGFIHLGILQALDERGVKPNIIAGTSAGAIAGVFLAAGIKPNKILKILKGRIFTYSRIRWPKDGIFSLEGLQNVLNKEIGVDKIEDLEIPLIITATNLNTGKTEYIEQGPLTEAVLASSSIPVIFRPIVMNGHKYSDGGLLDNLPLTPLMNRCKKTIAINISPVEQMETVNGILRIAARTFQMSVNSQAHRLKDKCTLFIEPTGLKKYDLLDLDKADDMFQIGYQYANGLDLSKVL